MKKRLLCQSVLLATTAAGLGTAAPAAFSQSTESLALEANNRLGNDLTSFAIRGFGFADLHLHR